MEKQKMRLIVASNNANKLREFREILGEQFDIVSMREKQELTLTSKRMAQRLRKTRSLRRIM